MLRFLLLLRAALNGTFAWLFLTTLAGESERFTQGGHYAFADGIAGLLLACALHRSVRSRWLTALAAIDGLARLAFGAAVLAFPLQDDGVGFLIRTIFLGLTFVAAAGIGLTGVFYAELAGRGRQRVATGSGDVPEIGVRWPALLASAATLLFAVGSIRGPLSTPDQRPLLTGLYAAALGIVFLLAGLLPGRRLDADEHPAA